MSASQSDLTASRYGYDFVVATTQASINATMKEFLDALTEPVVRICYVADAKGNPVLIDFDQLVKNARGTNPFDVPANADPSGPAITSLLGARFMVGFRARIGLPPGLAPAQIPDLVQLGDDTSAVTFSMLCSEFTIVQLTPGGGYTPEPTWLSVSQEPGHPWVFTSKVDLRLSTTGSSAYGKLPPAVQAQIKNMGGTAFSVQQLLFDLDNAALQTIPVISGVDPSSQAHDVLTRHFLGGYFTQLQNSGQPVLGVTITDATAPVSSLTMTDLNLEVSPLVGTNGQPVSRPTAGQQDLATLNYLCAANGNALPPPVPFTWNWVDQSEESDVDGVVAINRATFTNYFRYQLMSYVQQNCYLPSVRLTTDSGGTVTTNASLTAGQSPTVTTPASGTEVLTFHYDADSSDVAGLNGDLAQMDLHPTYDASVTFSGSTITIAQHLKVYLRVQHLATSASGNVVDVTVTDTYTIAVNQDGQLATTLATDRKDNSQDLSVNSFLDFFTDLNDTLSKVQTWLRAVTSTRLTDIPVSAVQSFVFPGGRTFAFKSAAFSATGDLASHITYTDPS